VATRAPAVAAPLTAAVAAASAQRPVTVESSSSSDDDDDDADNDGLLNASGQPRLFGLGSYGRSTGAAPRPRAGTAALKAGSVSLAPAGPQGPPAAVPPVHKGEDETGAAAQGRSGGAAELQSASENSKDTPPPAHQPADALPVHHDASAPPQPQDGVPSAAVCLCRVAVASRVPRQHC
jgi:hypothetical protein